MTSQTYIYLWIIFIYVKHRCRISIPQQANQETTHWYMSSNNRYHAMQQRANQETTHWYMSSNNRYHAMQQRANVSVYLHETWGIGKHRALIREGKCNFILYLEIGWTSVKTSWKQCIIRCLYTGVPYNNVYVWNRPNVKAPMLAVYLY